MTTDTESIRISRQDQPATTGQPPRGRENSRRNSMTHGLSGSGRVVPDEDIAEVNRLTESYVREYNVQTDIGHECAHLMAVMNVRMKRCALHELMAIAQNQRQAIDKHDDARDEEANRLFEELGEAPRINLRKLKRMPEGIELLIEAWVGLRRDLTRKPRARWSVWHRERAEILTGNRPDVNPYTEIGDLSEEIWGPASRVLDEDDPVLEAAKAKGREKMIERIDAEIAQLKAHDRTLDREMLELDRQEAPVRALFDASKVAQLARRYEAEASRRFFKLLAQLKQAEAEAAANPQPAAPPKPPAPPSSFRAPAPSPPSSFRETADKSVATPGIEDVMAFLKEVEGPGGVGLGHKPGVGPILDRFRSTK